MQSGKASMSARMERFVIVFLGILVFGSVIYGALIPSIWTQLVRGKKGYSNGQSMTIEDVVVWPDRFGYCYRVYWEFSSEEIDVGNGKVIVIPPSRREGYCFPRNFESR